MNKDQFPPANALEDYVRHRLSLRLLRVVERVARLGSLQAAADDLGVTQPAISKSLQEVEKGLGLTLFCRKERRWHATPAALQLVTLCLQLEAELERGAQRVLASARGELGEVRIGSTTAALVQLLPRVVSNVQAAWPRLTLSVSSSTMARMLGLLDEGRLDLLLTRSLAVDLPQGIQVEKLCDKAEVVVISCLHPDHAKRDWTWEALQQQAWLGAERGTWARRQFENFWRDRSMEVPTCQVTTDDALFMLMALRHVPALSVMNRPLAELGARLGYLRILPIPTDLGLRPLSVWYRPETLSDAGQRVLAVLRTEAAVP